MASLAYVQCAAENTTGHFKVSSRMCQLWSIVLHPYSCSFVPTWV